MSRICPNCKHVRQANADCPEWQCPSCERAYNKGAGAPVNEQYGTPAILASEPHGSGFARWLMILALLGGAAWIGKDYWQRAPEVGRASVQARE